MADYALFVGWNRSVAGGEQQAMGLFARVMEYYGQLQNDGKIESFEPVVLSNHGGDLNGFVLLRGDAAKLEEVGYSRLKLSKDEHSFTPSPCKIYLT